MILTDKPQIATAHENVSLPHGIMNTVACRFHHAARPTWWKLAAVDLDFSSAGDRRVQLPSVFCHEHTDRRFGARNRPASGNSLMAVTNSCHQYGHCCFCARSLKTDIWYRLFRSASPSVWPCSYRRHYFTSSLVFAARIVSDGANFDTNTPSQSGPARNFYLFQRLIMIPAPPMRTNSKTQAMPSETISPMKNTQPNFLLCLSVWRSSWLPPTGRTDESRHFNTSKPVRLDNILQIRHPHTNGLSDIYLLNDLTKLLCRSCRLYRICRTQPGFAHYIWRNDIRRLLFNQVFCRRTRCARTLAVDRQQHCARSTTSCSPRQPSQYRSVVNPSVLRKWRDSATWPTSPPQPPHAQQLYCRQTAPPYWRTHTATNTSKLGEDTVFADLDILATASVVGEVSTDFDRYWASLSAHNATRIIRSGNIGKGSSSTGYNDESSVATRSCATAKPSNSRPLPKIQTGRIDRQRSKPAPSATTLKDLRSRPPQNRRLPGGCKTRLNSPKSVYRFTLFRPHVTAQTHLANCAGRHRRYRPDQSRYRRPTLPPSIPAMLTRNRCSKFKIKLTSCNPTHAVPAKDRFDLQLRNQPTPNLHCGRQTHLHRLIQLDPVPHTAQYWNGRVIESPKIAEQMERTLADTTPNTPTALPSTGTTACNAMIPPPKTYLNEPEAKLWKRIAAKILSLLPIAFIEMQWIN